MKNQLVRKLAVMALTVVTAFQLIGCGTQESATQTETQTQQTTQSETQTEETTDTELSGKGFHVEGTKLLDANDEEFIMRGINHAHTWFSGSDLLAFKAIADTGANCVRIVLSDGQQFSKDELGKVDQVLKLCKRYDMIAVVEVHDGTGSDDPAVLDKIVDYWIDTKILLNGNESYVILNIANEWFGSWNNTDVWADAYVSAVKKLRDAGIKNTLMVDSAGWGQYYQSLSDHAKTIFDADPEGNTMFSIHMYGNAGKNAETIEKAITGVTDQGLCVCVGEFGYKHSDGDVDEAFIMEYCEDNGIGYMAWSWKGNGSPVEYLDLTEDWAGTKLTPEWGEVLVNGENGIKETSKICSVFAE